ncbi:uncharacterized protein DS421_20g702450 [Arachis hypogaea]|nr:uncharacterized protein DS421_20g702450 [Arachis hypogaea]
MGLVSLRAGSIARKANLEKSDLEPALKALKDRLMTQNMACADAVVQKSIRATMEEALVRILTLRCSIDILRDVHAAKEQRKLYVAEFIGVNGVGESTNLDQAL